MNPQEGNEDYQLWRKYRDAAGEEKPAAAPAPNILAAYLDGSATAEEIAAVEAAMSQNPDLLQEIIELQALESAEPAEIPVALRSNILPAVLNEIAGIPAGVNPYRTDKVYYLNWLQAAAGVAAVLLVSFFGFKMGQETMAMDLQAEAVVTANISEGLDEENAEAQLLQLNLGIAAKEVRP